MSQFAKNTSVSSERSRAEIEKTLRRYGADQFVSGWNADQAVIGFTMNNRQVKFVLPLPDRKQFRFTEARRQVRSDEAQDRAYEQAIRQRWRALGLVIKAKLEAVELGIAVFEDEFLANIVLPNGATMGAWARPQIEQAYESGHMPALLPQLEDKQ